MKPAAFRLILILVVLILVIMIGAVGFMILEDLSLGNALYFTIMSVTTVGYGDIYPTTAGGKILAVFMIVTGVGTFLALVAQGTELLLKRSQEKLRRDQINMTVDVFFSEFGAQLLRIFSSRDTNLYLIRRNMLVGQDWNESDFMALGRKLEKHSFDLAIDKEGLQKLRGFFTEQGDLLVNFLNSPNLVEHEAFAQLLLATLHFKEELVYRPATMDLPAADIEHLVNDAKRSYLLLAKQWVEYMRFLQIHYPYLFSLALRTNPFNEAATPVIT